MKKYLIVNIGSTSRRYAIYSDDHELFSSHLSKKEKIFISDLLFAEELIQDKSDISAIGIRVVAPGVYFLKNRVINKRYLTELRKVESSAPLHITPVLEEIRRLKKEFPETKLIGVSDSRFHKDFPDKARTYGLPYKIAEKYDLHRYGYHGISFESVVDKLRQQGPLPKKLIICHLGGGSSVTAVNNGKSVDTTMGFTPLEGLPGGTRVGDIGPGAVIYLSEKLKTSCKKLEHFLNTECGFKGLGGSQDMMILLELEKSKDKKKAKKANLAIELFIYKIRKYIGAFTATLDGLDMLVFTGVMGEESNIIRRRICTGLDHLGINLSQKLNKEIQQGIISPKASKVKVAIVLSSEMNKIYKETRKLS